MVTISAIAACSARSGINAVAWPRAVPTVHPNGRGPALMAALAPQLRLGVALPFGDQAALELRGRGQNRRDQLCDAAVGDVTQVEQQQADLAPLEVLDGFQGVQRGPK